MCGTDNFDHSILVMPEEKANYHCLFFFPLPKLRHLGYKGIASAAWIFQYKIRTAKKIWAKLTSCVNHVIYHNCNFPLHITNQIHHLKYDIQQAVTALQSSEFNAYEEIRLRPFQPHKKGGNKKKGTWYGYFNSQRMKQREKQMVVRIRGALDLQL